MPFRDDRDLSKRLDDYVRLLEKRRIEPDPFKILNIDRSESPYTHFLGWALDPHAPHPWKSEFLIDLLTICGQPLPPAAAETLTFHIESFGFEKRAEDLGGFTHPDIVAHEVSRGPTTWCMILENKFDSKEGRAKNKATQCATYGKRAREHFCDAKFALLFTSRTGVAPLGESNFAPVSYETIAKCFRTTRDQLERVEKWTNASGNIADRYACYLLDSFLDHLDFLLPDADVRDALKTIERGDQPRGVSIDWLRMHPELSKCDADLRDVVATWNYDEMLEQLIADGANVEEQAAFDVIYQWGRKNGRCEFNSAKKPSFIVAIPTCQEDVQIVCIQGRLVRFYWGHFIGAYTDAGKKFPHAFELAKKYCERLNDVFGWDLQVVKGNGGFFEPSKPLKDVSPPDFLTKFLCILDDVAKEALAAPIETVQ